MEAVKVQCPAVMALARIVGFLDAGSRLGVRLERLLPQMARLTRKLPRLRVAPTCAPTASP